jgi:site-specific DNA recombinase
MESSNKTLSALAYNRKSRGDVSDLQKLKKELMDYCKRNGFKTTYFEEIGSSVNSEREEYVKLINEIKTGKYDVLVITDLSRLTRDLEEQLKLFKLLNNHDMVIHSLLDGIINPKEKTNKMLGVLKGAFNELVFEETSEKMHLGRLLSAREGKWVTPAPYGYKKNKDTMKLELDEVEAPVVRRIFREVIEGYSTTEISVRLHKDGIKTRKGSNFHPSTISNLLERRTYIGETNFKSEKFGEEVNLKGTHEGIVTLEEFMQVRNILAGKQHFKARTHAITSPLDKLIVCGKCGRLMQVNLNSKGRYIHLQKCNAYKYGEQCDNSGCSITMLLPEVYIEVKKRIKVLEKQLESMYEGKGNKQLEILQDELKGIEKQIKDKEKEKDRLLNFLLNGTVSEIIYTTKNKELESDIKSLQQRFEDTSESIANNNISNDTEYLEGLVKNLIDLEQKPVDEQNRILKSVIEKIVYVREGNDIDMDIQFKD